MGKPLQLRALRARGPNGGRPEQSGPPPGNFLKLSIQEVAFGGRGVGRLEDGRVVFVPFVAAGETVRVEIIREHRSYLEARLLAVEEPSPRRVSPPCPYFGRCGGCSYQHLDAGEQRDTKRRQVAGVLRRVGRFEQEIDVRPVVPSPLDYGYRNRITVHVREDAVGFFAHGSAGTGARELVDIARCPIAADGVNDALARFRARPPRQREEGNYTLRADGAGPAEGFRQTNDGAAAELLAIVAGCLGDTGAPPTHLLDAYCGAGFFARHLRGRFESVVGVEWDRRAVDAARREAAAHEEYRCGDVAALLPGELTRLPAEGSVLIVDPPSEGLAGPVRAAVAAVPVAEMVYVSCNPATLARDLGALRSIYGIVSVTPLDMFPQTAEIEVVAHLRKKP